MKLHSTRKCLVLPATKNSKDRVWLHLTKMNCGALKRHMAQGAADIFQIFFGEVIQKAQEDHAFERAAPHSKDFWKFQAKYELLVVWRVANDEETTNTDFLVERVLMVEEALENYGLNDQDVFDLMKSFITPASSPPLKGLLT